MSMMRSQMPNANFFALRPVTILIDRRPPIKPNNSLLLQTDRAFLAFICNERLKALNITVRKLFGGKALECDGVFFGFVYQASLFLLTDLVSRDKYVAAGMEAFAPTPAKRLKDYFEVPEEILEDNLALEAWVNEAIDVGR